ncbi:hypothetical protein E8E12_010595 [Didymella heteroderae]|uniref:Uncharacterized protein n=1 Tax=Didymella heteroderae TaxID=1769908 RepID=A0A9P4X0Y8_9PLEO|nr:hypothetical protein E8E12_010595 [Didymella heteroderae]
MALTIYTVSFQVMKDGEGMSIIVSGVLLVKLRQNIRPSGGKVRTFLLFLFHTDGASNSLTASRPVYKSQNAKQEDLPEFRNGGDYLHGLDGYIERRGCSHYLALTTSILAQLLSTQQSFN